MSVAQNINKVQKIHPKQFMLYLGMGSMIMFFSALSSALIVKRGDFKHWVEVPVPSAFLISTLFIILSSIAIEYVRRKALKSHKNVLLYCFITLILGLVFIFFQYQGWNEMKEMGILLNGNPSGSFIYVISYLHLAHFAFGVFFLLRFMWMYYSTSNELRGESLEFNMSLLTQYWHFIGIIWVYLYLLFKFLIYN